jgi:hypothetical protein
VAVTGIDGCGKGYVTTRIVTSLEGRGVRTAALVLPLRDRRSVRLEAEHAEETAMTYRKHLYEFQGTDVTVLEGICLLGIFGDMIVRGSIVVAGDPSATADSMAASESWGQRSRTTVTACNTRRLSRWDPR